ncbi:unnamed protein product [Paramecium pentaurelia]|uniref:Uncharacterized protein n=1 Tax=Paramecium pentaurelia TaxID=43138 RepID=A0A8S1UJE4_9CILI|nr:unnamed protein product [Paramecium pentaurelia]
MKAFLLVCLIATSMMVNAIEIPKDQVLSGQSDSPSFLHVQTFQACQYCCGGKCCLSPANCVKGVCNNVVAPTCVQG